MFLPCNLCLHCLGRNNTIDINLIFDTFKIRSLNLYPACKDTWSYRVLEKTQLPTLQTWEILYRRFRLLFSFKKPKISYVLNPGCPFRYIMHFPLNHCPTFSVCYYCFLFFCFLTWPALPIRFNFWVLNVFSIRNPAKDYQRIDSLVIKQNNNSTFMAPE